MHTRATLAPLAAALALSLALLPACVDQQRQTTEGHDVYTLMGTTEIEGRQGIAQDGEHHWVSDSDALYLYDADWNLIAKNDTPFATGIAPSANHISDIDVYDGLLYCGIEHFENAAGSDIQIAVYDAQTLTFQRTFAFDPASGQDEISGVTVNPTENTLVACSWTQSGAYLYRYDLSSGAYLNKVRLQDGPQHIQGIAYREGAYYLTADDGNEDAGEPDHVYRATFGPSSTTAEVTRELDLDALQAPGEIEGLTFDEVRRQLLVLHNRGAIIVDGMPVGLRDSYDREIHEVFSYDMV